MARSIHHTTVKPELGKCLICGNPFLMYWHEQEEINGFSDQYTEKKEGVVHFKCAGGKSLHQLNEERKKLAQ